MKTVQFNGSGVRASLELSFEITQWMNQEAEWLDDLREREWLEQMVSQEIVYQVPIRQTVSRARGTGFLAGSFHMNENYSSLNMRVKRNETGFAWAEDPPSRVRRFVSNVRVSAPNAEGHVMAKSNLLIFRTRSEQTVPALFSGERHDELSFIDGAWKLSKRIVYLDLTAIGSHNFAMFL